MAIWSHRASSVAKSVHCHLVEADPGRVEELRNQGAGLSARMLAYGHVATTRRVFALIGRRQVFGGHKAAPLDTQPYVLEWVSPSSQPGIDRQGRGE